MECEKIRERFSAFLEGDLDPLGEKVLREHLQSCAACRSDFEAFKKTINWVHATGEMEAPEGFLAEIYQKMKERKRKGHKPLWRHRLMQLKLPAQAVAMVAIVFVVLYVTKMIPVETHREREVESGRTPPSAATADSHGVQKEPKTNDQRIALRSKVPRTTERMAEKTPIPNGKGVQKEARPSLDAAPLEEIILRVSDREKTTAHLQSLVQQFEGEIVKADESGFLASLPTHSYLSFKQRLEVIVASKKAEPSAPPAKSESAFRVSSKAKDEVSAVETKERGRKMADQGSRVTVRIVLVKE